MQTLSTLLKPHMLHIPDGLLSLYVAGFFWLVTIGLILIASRKTRMELGDRRVPLMGIMAAFIFAAQMINFPIAGGTSGHLLGGVLAAIALGPWAGMLVMASVIGVQALLFQDGGLLVMGANIFNMGFLPVLIGYGIYRLAPVGRPRWGLTLAGLAAWLSVVASAFATSLQLWMSGVALLRLVMPAMLGVHVLIGIGEALITVAALAFILRSRPDLIKARHARFQKDYGWIIGGLVVVLLVLLVAPFASTNPDGFERVAADLGFLDFSQEASYQVLPDYTLPVLPDSPLSTILAGMIGVAVVAALTILLVWLIKRSTRTHRLPQR